MAKQDWKRLADFVVSRRTELGMMTRRDLSRATASPGQPGINDRTIGKLETGASVSASTMSTIERTLGWTPGSWRRILEGGDPELANAKTAAAPPARVYSDPVLQAAWESLADIDLPEDVKRGMIRYALAAKDEAAQRTG